MRGNEKVISELNSALQAELTAIVQYFVHAEMCDNWGYKHLGGYIKKQAIDEMRHAEGLIERILFLDGTPAIGVTLAPQVGGSVKAQHENDLAGELDAVKQYNAAVQVCVQAADDGSRALFEKMVQDEEKHANFLEARLHAIKEMGLDNYLSQQLHASE